MMPSKEQTLDKQVDTVLSVIGALTPFIIAPLRDFDPPRELDGGVAASAVTTFAAACDRLDKMLKDESKWDLKGHDGLYAAMTAHFSKAAEMHTAQTQTLLDMRRPCNIRRPHITLIDGEFIAIWGDPSRPGNHIMGKGLTPEAALADYDAAFARRAEEQWSIAVEPAPAPPEPPVAEAEVIEPKRKKKKY